jgi:hypothetical protein
MVQQRAIHNAYRHGVREGLMDQLIYYRVRNLEWDIHAAKPYTAERFLENDWYMYHTTVAEDLGRCHMLSDCLRLLKAFHDAVPSHEVITIQLEPKGGGEGSFPPAFVDSDDPARQTPAGLDARLRDTLGAALFTPADFLARCPGKTTLQEAVETCGWPTLRELRGRILITLHAYTTIGHDVTKLNPGVRAIMQYGLGDAPLAQSRVAFLAPLFLTAGEQWEETVLAHPEVVFHTEVKAAPRFMSRLHDTFPGHIFRSDDRPDETTFHVAQMSHNFVLTDHVSFHQQGYARTHNRFGYPFCPVGVMGADCWTSDHALASTREIQHLVALEVRSGDLGGMRDSFAFGYEDTPTVAASTWSAFVSGSSDSPRVAGERGVDHWAKGCLMARADLGDDSPYYAVCRAGDEEELFVQYRTGDSTARASASLAHGIEAEDAIFVRLELVPEGSGVVAQGYGSADGHDWQPIGGPVRFSRDLRLQGVAASSYQHQASNADGTPTRFYFGNLKKNDTRYSFSKFARTKVLPELARVGEVGFARRLDLSYFGRRESGSCDYSPIW